VCFELLSGASEGICFFFTPSGEAMQLDEGESLSVKLTFSIDNPKDGAMRFGLWDSLGTLPGMKSVMEGVKHNTRKPFWPKGSCMLSSHYESDFRAF